MDIVSSRVFLLCGISQEQYLGTIQSEMAEVAQKDLRTYNMESGADYFFDNFVWFG
jgi:hypothetical protein